MLDGEAHVEKIAQDVLRGRLLALDVDAALGHEDVQAWEDEGCLLHALVELEDGGAATGGYHGVHFEDTQSGAYGQVDVEVRFRGELRGAQGAKLGGEVGGDAHGVIESIGVQARRRRWAFRRMVAAL